MPLRLPSTLALLFLSLMLGSLSFAKDQTQARYKPDDPANAVAFEYFYSQDYVHAVAEFAGIVQRHPDDPFAVNHLLGAILFGELDRIGAMNSGEYANDSFIKTPRRGADPKVKDRIKELLERAKQLEEKRLNANPNDVDTLYARGVTRAQLATYTALVERSWISALRSALGARHDHERVLQLDPNYSQAKLIVGAHNYVVGNLSWPVKTAISVVGLGGNKEKGLQLLQEAAAGPGEAGIDAKILLIVFLRREHRYDEALPIARPLIARYPRNLLLAVEEGNLLRSAGRYQEAASVYSRVWQAGRENHYPGLHYELAALSLGELLRSQKDYSAAAAAYELVNEVPQSDPEMQQKANLAAGEMYDILLKRDMAMRKYEAVLASNATSPPAEMARKCMKDPCRGQ